MSDSMTMREALLRDIADLKRERDEAREAFAVATDQLVQAQAALREAREALIPFICLNPKSQRVKKKWDGFVQAAKKVLEAAK